MTWREVTQDDMERVVLNNLRHPEEAKPTKDLVSLNFIHEILRSRWSLRMTWREVTQDDMENASL